jgi:pyridoxamine 5'-phosphate oxidase
MSIASIRKDYQLQSLTEEGVLRDPFDQFTRWWDDALKAEIEEVNAMTLSTVKPDGRPAARVVLLKGFDPDGFVFFTNYTSDKGSQLEQTPYAALVFFWKELERQVRIEGACTKVSAEESDAYFISRPLGSRLGAWTSPQSRVIESRELLERRAAELAKQYEHAEVPRPPFWGGYRVVPDTVEFWQGRSNRLHDRIRFFKSGPEWKIERIAP